VSLKFGLWRVDGTSVQRVPPGAIASEAQLETVIEAQIDILGLGDLLQIGRQVITDFGKRIDLLAIDSAGDIYVLELKRDRTPREVVAQALEYGYWVQSLSFDNIADLYGHHNQG
jgi:RecB family endonuclease NucS